MKKLDYIEDEFKKLKTIKKICEYNSYHCYDDSGVELDLDKLQKFTEDSVNKDSDNKGKLIIILPQHIKKGFEIVIQIHITELSVVAAALSRINNIKYQKWLSCVTNINVEKAYFKQKIGYLNYTALVFKNIKNPYSSDDVFLFDDTVHLKNNKIINEKRDEIELIINEELNR